MNQQDEQENWALQRFDINRQRRVLREQQEELLTIAYAGGMFKIDSSLLALANTWPEQEILFLEDSYGNPIKIEEPKLFAKECRQQWYQVMNEWHIRWQQISKYRRISNI